MKTNTVIENFLLHPVQQEADTSYCPIISV